MNMKENTAFSLDVHTDTGHIYAETYSGKRQVRSLRVGPSSTRVVYTPAVQAGCPPSGG